MHMLTKHNTTKLMVSPCSDVSFDVSTGSDGSVVYYFCILLVLMIDGSTGSTDSEDFDCSIGSNSSLQ